MNTGRHELVIERPGEFRIAAHTPRPPGYGEALVRVHAVGICGSDREVFHGTRPTGFVRYPLVPGHEWSGTVEAVGQGVPGSLIGRKVVGEGFRSCLRCARCRAGETTLCEAEYAETGFTVPGAMASTLTLPARLLHVLADDADLTAAALLEPLACVAAAALIAEVRPGNRVAVVGTGTLGVLALQLLGASSPGELVAVGRGAVSAERAHRHGAHTYLTYDNLAHAEGFDIVVEAAGSARSASVSSALVRRGGRLVLTGIPAPGAVPLDPADLVIRQVEVRTVFGANSGAWAHAVRAFTAGLVDLRSVATHRMSLGEYADAIALMGEARPDVGKILLLPGSTA
ncbi:zinc-dependent alcohol dehydrogenase [Nocardia carnea]|uniref:zinc-dependent alcohol dehydrogenase n=1 Tax=Nocardia carnea TaxID=37328 RepID=UPI0024559644|nr:alcohol dehydrogenase catalytic domain-containing protein [Nocardia carnea]